MWQKQHSKLELLTCEIGNYKYSKLTEFVVICNNNKSASTNMRLSLFRSSVCSVLGDGNPLHRHRSVVLHNKQRSECCAAAAAAVAVLFRAWIMCLFAVGLAFGTTRSWVVDIRWRVEGSVKSERVRLLHFAIGGQFVLCVCALSITERVCLCVKCAMCSYLCVEGGETDL